MRESMQARLSAIETLTSELRSDLSMGRGAAARAVTALTARVASAEPEEAVGPLRMGKVVFYGESARQIRAAQAVLRAAGVGQLEVLKRANEPGEPFVVIDGQVFIAEATIKTAVIEPGRFEIKVAVNEHGRHVAAGIGVGVKTCPVLGLGSHLVDGIRNLLRDELKPGGMLHRPIGQPSN